MNALTFIDKILECLSQDGPETGRTYASISRKDFPAFQPGLTFLGMRVVPPLISPRQLLLDLGGPVIPHALKLSRAYYEVILDSYPKFLSFCLFEQLEAFRSMASWNLEDFVKNAKFFTAYPLARFLKNTLPVRPNSFPLSLHTSLFSGRLKRFFKTRIVSFNRKNLGFFLGLLQGVKRGAETVPVSFVREAMLKHRATLTQVRNGPDAPDSWSDQLNFAEYSPYYERFFKKFKPMVPRLFEASTSAGYSSKRSEGGARNFLKQLVNYKSLIDTEENDLLEMYESRPGSVHQTFGQTTWTSFGHLLSDIGLMASEPRLFPNLLHNSVAVSAVCEPLKVRLITKGNEVSYYASKFYQKSLWQYLQKYPQFVATGRPVQVSDFLDLLTREDRLFSLTPRSRSETVAVSLTAVKAFDSWVSGDYSAATDSLKIEHTKAAFESSLLRSKLDSPIQDLLRSVLYEQHIHYPKKFEKSGGLDPIMQTTGQLMGSTLSFPILCTVNLVAYWKALEEYFGRQISLVDLPVLINGDDILFRSNDDFYRIWMDKISEVGFLLSLGKNYVHKTFLTINSQGFLFDRGTRGFFEIGFLNVGLLTGQSKIGKRKHELLPLNSIYNEVLRGSHDPLRCHRRFMHYQRKGIEQVTQSGQFSLFISPILGGCGFDLFPEVKPSIYFTGFQAKLASFIYQEVVLPPHQSDYEPFKALSYRLPVLQDSVLNINVKRKVFHHGSYRLIPSLQPNREDQVDVLERPSGALWNVGSVDPESHPLNIRSFPIKTILSFRKAIRDSASVIRYHRRLNPLFLSLKVRLVEEKGSKAVMLHSNVPKFSMDEYLD